MNCELRGNTRIVSVFPLQKLAKPEMTGLMRGLKNIESPDEVSAQTPPRTCTSNKLINLYLPDERAMYVLLVSDCPVSTVELLSHWNTYPVRCSARSTILSPGQALVVGGGMVRLVGLGYIVTVTLS